MHQGTTSNKFSHILLFLRCAARTLGPLRLSPVSSWNMHFKSQPFKQPQPQVLGSPKPPSTRTMCSVNSRDFVFSYACISLSLSLNMYINMSIYDITMFLYLSLSLYIYMFSSSSIDKSISIFASISVSRSSFAIRTCRRGGFGSQCCSAKRSLDLRQSSHNGRETVWRSARRRPPRRRSSAPSKVWGAFPAPKRSKSKYPNVVHKAPKFKRH